MKPRADRVRAFSFFRMRSGCMNMRASVPNAWRVWDTWHSRRIRTARDAYTVIFRAWRQECRRSAQTVLNGVRRHGLPSMQWWHSLRWMGAKQRPSASAGEDRLASSSPGAVLRLPRWSRSMAAWFRNYSGMLAAYEPKYWSVTA